MAMAAHLAPGDKLYCEFLTVYDDASSVLTNNSVDVGVFKPFKTKDVAVAPWLADVRDLYRLHLYRESQFRPPAAVRYVPPLDRSLAMVGEGTAKDMLRQVEAGYFAPTGAPGKYRPTFAGAYRMTWKELPPVKQLRRAAAHRKARAQEHAARSIALSPPANVRLSRTSPYAAPS
jgi:hypothetical protein